MTPELEAKLSALLDGELTPEETAALRQEIARRLELAARLAELAAVDEALRALPGWPVPADLRARLDRRIRAEGRAWARTATPARRPPTRSRRWLAAAALAVAAAALALVALPRLQSDEAQVAETEPAPAGELAEQAPPAPVPALEEALAEAEDLPVIAVLDVLAELDELEGAPSG